MQEEIIPSSGEQKPDLVMVNVNTEPKPKKSGGLQKVLQYVLVVFACFVCLYFLIKSASGDNSEQIKQVNSTVKAIQATVDSMNETQSFLAERMMEMESRQISFDEKIDENNRQLARNTVELSRIKKMYYEKIRSVNSYSTSQLDSFLRARYLPIKK